MGEVEAGHCGDQRGSLCQRLPEAENPSRRDSWPLDEWKRLIPEGGLGQALWRRKMRGKTRGEETCC